MVVEYSQHCPISKAIAQTFDGDHPCDLCKEIQQSKKQSDQQQKYNFSASNKIDLRMAAARLILFPPTHFDLQCVPDRRAVIRTDVPPVPPPRLA
jgi:hypothetical protein